MYKDLKVSELKEIAEARGIADFQDLKKAELVERLEALEKKFFKFIPDENRWELSDEDPAIEEVPKPLYHRTFDQKGQVHTSEDVLPVLSAAYNLEDQIAINDNFLKEGANARGQQIGDASGNRHVRDRTAEGGI